MAKGTPKGRAPDTRSTRGRSVDTPHVTLQQPSILGSPPGTSIPPSTDHVLDHVLALLGFNKLVDPTHIVLNALSDGGYNTLVDLFSLTRGDVQSLTYFSDTGSNRDRLPLPRGNQVALLVPQGFRMYFQKCHGAPISAAGWLNITKEDINTYRLSDEYMFFNNSDGSSTVPPTSPAVTQHKPSFEAFKKAIRRDPNQFKTFDDPRHWSLSAFQQELG